MYSHTSPFKVSDCSKVESAFNAWDQYCSIIADIFLIFVDNFHLAIEPIRLQRLKLETRRLISIMAL